MIVVLGLKMIDLVCMAKFDWYDGSLRNLRQFIVSCGVLFFALNFSRYLHHKFMSDNQRGYL